EHSIHVGLVGGKRWSILVTTHRLEDDGLTYLTGRDPLHRSCIRRVVAAHETNLQTNTCLSHSLQRKMGISKIHRQGLFAKNVLSRSSSNTDCLCMKFVGSSYQDTIDVFALNHILKGGKCVLDFKLRGDLMGALRRGIGHGNQPRFWNEPPKVLCMPLPHFSDAKYSDSDLRHSESLKQDILPVC